MTIATEASERSMMMPVAVVVKRMWKNRGLRRIRDAPCRLWRCCAGSSIIALNAFEPSLMHVQSSNGREQLLLPCGHIPALGTCPKLCHKLVYGYGARSLSLAVA